MEKINFNYRNRQGQAIEVNISKNEIRDFEADYKNKIKAKYDDRLDSPRIEVVISEDGFKILDVHIIAKGVLEKL